MVWHTPALDDRERVSAVERQLTAPVGAADSSHQAAGIVVVGIAPAGVVGNPVSARHNLLVVGPELDWEQHRPPYSGVRRRESGRSCVWRR